jgi:hypothetical protein
LGISEGSHRHVIDQAELLGQIDGHATPASHERAYDLA